VILNKQQAKTDIENRPSLESFIENEGVGLEILHPGGLEITGELAELCHIGKGLKVLDVASGTGESAFYLVQNFSCNIIGIDISDHMKERATKKVMETGVIIEFKRADAHYLPFNADSFDAVISERTTCILDKERVIREMIRVTKPGGFVGIHDICWTKDTPEDIKQRLAEIEGERPETLDGWKNLFDKAGLIDVITVDKSYLIKDWKRDIMKKIGFMVQLRLFLKIINKWGFGGLMKIMESGKIFQSQHVGYGIIVGKKP